MRKPGWRYYPGWRHPPQSPPNTQTTLDRILSGTEDRWLNKMARLRIQYICLCGGGRLLYDIKMPEHYKTPSLITIQAHLHWSDTLRIIPSNPALMARSSGTPFVSTHILTDEGIDRVITTM